MQEAQRSGILERSTTKQSPAHLFIRVGSTGRQDHKRRAAQPGATRNRPEEDCDLVSYPVELRVSHRRGCFKVL